MNVGRGARGASALAFALLIAGCGSKHAPPAPDKVATTAATGVRTVRFDHAALARLGVKAEPAGSGSSERLRFPGTLEYDLERYAEVGAAIEGRVSTINARPGDRVKKGQRLATILVPSLASAQADVVGARAAAQVSTEHAQRESSLLEQRLTTAREAEVARGESIRADAELAAAKARLKALGISAIPAGDSIEAAGALTLTSPIDGVVVRRDAVLGTFLQPNETAFVVADATRLWATIQIYEFDLRYVQVGSEAKITIDAMPGKTLTGKVALIEPEVGTATRALRARIPIDNADHALRAGLFVRATVDLPGEEALLVPVGAVQPVGEEDVVFVQREPGVYEVRSVHIARRGPQLAEVSAGLERGEPIVVEGAYILRGELSKQ